MRKTCIRFIGILLLGCLFSSKVVAEMPSVKRGAAVFYERCALCHGAQGLGDGILPIKIQDYPNTRLKVTEQRVTRDMLRIAVMYGGQKGAFSNLMPPMGDELTAFDLESVVLFLELLNSDFQAATELIDSYVPSVTKPNAHKGKLLYSTLCTLCHGPTGKGDGRMASLIDKPAPADLTKSTVPSLYIEKIIELGGEKMGRSTKMPPWGDQLNKNDIESLALYLMKLRSSNQ